MNSLNILQMIPEAISTLFVSQMTRTTINYIQILRMSRAATRHLRVSQTIHQMHP